MCKNFLKGTLGVELAIEPFDIEPLRDVDEDLGLLEILCRDVNDAVL